MFININFNDIGTVFNIFSVKKDNIDVIDVDWSGSRSQPGNLTDTTVTEKLKEITEFVGELDISRNSLSAFPDFAKYRQLHSLEELFLYANTIQTLEWENVPTQVQYIDLSYNQLENIPVVSQSSRCLQVKELRLNKNRIQTVEGSSIPPIVEIIHLDNNQITAVGDLSHLPLTKLDLDKNQLSD